LHDHASWAQESAFRAGLDDLMPALVLDLRIVSTELTMRFRPR